MTTKDKVEKRIRELVPSVIHYPEPIGDNVYATGGSYTYIHLEHILMAIEKVGSTRSLQISMHKNFYFHYKDDVGYCSNYKYLLDKPFSDQSEELYLFLLDILTNH